MKNAPVLTRALVFGGMLALAVAIVGSVIGYLVAGVPGLLSALVGAVLAAVFMGLTTLSILFAQRATAGDPSTGRYFGIIVGVWALKFLVFVGALVLLRDQPWLNPLVFLLTLIAAVIGSLVVDAIAMLGARVPYVGDIDLPGQSASAQTLPGTDR
ncbi:MAG: hypothetical protein ABJB03_00135 [Rhodoglobus sp.]